MVQTEKRIKIFIYFMGFSFAILVVMAIIIHSYNIVINVTNSYPIGLYALDTQSIIRKNNLVVVCPPSGSEFKKNYNNTLEVGSCKTGTIPLIKKIVAVAGDVVEVNDYVKVNGQYIKNSMVRKVGSKGNKLYPCYGKHTIKKGTVWIMSDYSDMSFDSRYFCEVPIDNTIGKAKLLLEF